MSRAPGVRRRRENERTHLMDTVKLWAARCLRLIKSRAFSAAVLAACSVAVITYVSVNMRVYTVIDGADSRVVLTLTDKPEKVVAAAGLTLNEGDELEAGQGEISVNRAFDVQVTVDGSTSVLRMTGGTVGDALDLLGVEMSKDDTVNVTDDQELSDGRNITIERVGYKEYTKTETIPYETTVKYTNTLPKGKTKVHTAGKKGVKTYVYRDRYVDGELAETVLVSETVTTKPVNEVILKGTVTGTPMSKAPFDIELDDAGQPVNFKKVYTGKATAYTNEGGILSKWTASGRRAQVGVVAVDPRKIPYGTKLYIVSPDGSYVYGYAIAGDTGGGVRKGTLIADLFMDTVAECYQFGRRTMNVYILE